MIMTGLPSLTPRMDSGEGDHRGNSIGRRRRDEHLGEAGVYYREQTEVAVLVIRVIAGIERGQRCWW